LSWTSPMELVKERNPWTNLECFKAKEPSVFEAWHFETQDLTQLMELAVHVGFAADVSAKSELQRDVDELLHGISERGAIGLTCVDQFFVLFDRFEKGKSFTAAELDGVLAINRRYFPFEESKYYEKDKIRNWKAKGFFTIGSI